jgi:electron transport complex protein RnfA
MASIREKLELADVPKAFQGLPLSFIITGLIALAFMGFSEAITRYSQTASTEEQ